jgi:hypothetical protein
MHFLEVARELSERMRRMRRAVRAGLVNVGEAQRWLFAAEAELVALCQA